jgi:hypothetical protein
MWAFLKSRHLDRQQFAFGMLRVGTGMYLVPSSRLLLGFTVIMVIYMIRIYESV